MSGWIKDIMADYRRGVPGARGTLVTIFASKNVEVRAQPWRSHGAGSTGYSVLYVEGQPRLRIAMVAEPTYDRHRRVTVWYAKNNWGGSVVVGDARYDEQDDGPYPRDYTRAEARKVATAMASEALHHGFDELRREFEQAEAVAAAMANNMGLKALDEKLQQLRMQLQAATEERIAMVAAIRASCVGPQGSTERVS